jgi:pyruvate formate lyase activating enzyme
MPEKNTTGTILTIQGFSLNDGPGIRTTVFLKGCDIFCKWCHTPEGRRHYPEVYQYWPNCTDCGKCDDVCPVGAISVLSREDYGGDIITKKADDGLEYQVQIKKKRIRKIQIDKSLCIGCQRCVNVCKDKAFVVIGKIVTAKEVLDEVEKDRPFYKESGGGMTISGGEPTSQPDFAYALLKGAKKRRIRTALDTNGCATWETYSRLLEYTDLVLLDIKHMNAEAHKKFAGVSNQNVLENARKIVASGVDTHFRVPVIMDVNDSAENMEATASFAEELGVKCVDLLPYHPWAGSKYRLLSIDFPYPKGKGYPKKKMAALRKIFRSHGVKTTVGG